jgi:hypothetical protein
VSSSYQAYGIGIHSSSRIPGLNVTKPGPTRFVLNFETGPEPEWAKAASSFPGEIRSSSSENNEAGDPTFILTEHANGRYHTLTYSEGARFVLDNSCNRLWGTIQPPLPQQDLGLYFLGPVLGFVLRQRYVTCLHASAVELHDQAVAFCGDSEFGKSTTAAALALNGRPVLCDDIVPVSQESQKYWATPGYPRVCLWPESVAALLGPGEDLPQLSPRFEKRYLPLDGVRARFTEHKKPLGTIYLLGERSTDTHAPCIQELSPREALLELVKNTYMNWLLNREQRACEFDELCKIVQQVPVRRLVAHSDGSKLGLLCERIFQDAESMLASR